ncbi:bacteriochlorophyll 4-vinyl reductase [Roseospirillum parvum]|nr:bacteriochlorophyll 4-vinyl reductase [Roseospirillum parvum]
MTQPADTVARIGPNAIIQVAQALAADPGPEVRDRLLTAAGLTHYLDRLPEAMVPESEVSALQAALGRELGTNKAAEVNRRAGAATAAYLLAHRIPRPAQVVLKALPAGPAAAILLKAVGKHAWTFAGSGTFSYRTGQPVSIDIAHCPICRDQQADGPVCDFYTATFETLFRTLVHPRTTATQTTCRAAGAPSCTFSLSWTT